MLTLIKLLDTLRLRQLSLVVSERGACDVPKLERLSSLELSHGCSFNTKWDIFGSPNIQELILPSVRLHFPPLISILSRPGSRLRHLDVSCWFAMECTPPHMDVEVRALDLSKLDHFRMKVLGSSDVVGVSVILRFVKKMSNATTIILRRDKGQEFTNHRLPLPDLLRSYIGSRSHDAMKTHCRLEVTHEGGEDIYRDLHHERGDAHSIILLSCFRIIIYKGLISKCK